MPRVRRLQRIEARAAQRSATGPLDRVLENRAERVIPQTPNAHTQTPAHPYREIYDVYRVSTRIRYFQLFNRSGRHATNFRHGGFDTAARVIGLPGLHPHELRHTAASLAIASGADVKVVQQMLGHSSATMTMDTYGHLFENRLDEVAEAMDAARSTARAAANAVAHADPRVAPLLPQADVIALAEMRRRSKTPGQEGFCHGSPDGIRTRATALRGRRARPLHNGAVTEDPTGDRSTFSLGY